MTDTQDLICEIQEHTAAHGGENTATHLLVQAAMALQRQADELEAIGAGGVSGPLVGQSQAMPDLSQLTERGAQAWAGVDAQELREGFSAADMATASAQGFRDGVASVAASAGSEPVARVNDDGFIVEIGDLLIAPGQKLYTHPYPLGGMVGGWIALPGTLPEPGTPVLLDIGKEYPIRAMWAAKHTVPAAGDDTDWGEYDEATDQYWCPEGWYEWNEHEDTNWAVSATPRAWAPLPPTTSAGSGKGE